jgi:Leucine-rich repeat (LRR) protein
MSGVLPFVRGIDFTKYNLDEDANQIRLLGDMQRLRWIRLNSVGISALPAEIYSLKKLEQVHAVRNSISAIDQDLTKLSCLRVLNLRHNNITNAHIPPNLNDLEDLAVLDLSYNELTEVPTNAEEAKTVLVLNLSHNQISSIPNYLFINLTDLVYLDLSDNKLEM